MRALAALVILLTGAALAQADQAARPLGESISVHGRIDGPERERVRSLTEAGTPTALLVLARGRGQDGAQWLRVRLGRRPNTASGWVRAKHVDLRERTTRILIDLSSRRLHLFSRTRRILTTRVIIGGRQSPTPVGTFAIWQILPGKARSTGPFELQLTGRSRAARGAARLAIHGMRGRLRAPLGSAVSLGCIRVPERPLRTLARLAPEGTRVRIRR